MPYQAIDNPYRYAGYEYIEEIGTYDLNARYYNPEIARFLSADPYYNLGNRVIGLYEINVPNAWSIVQANNIYVYCGNNPIKCVDLTGETGIDVAAILLINGFLREGKEMDFSRNTLFVDTLKASSIMNEEIDKKFEEFKTLDEESKTFPGSISFYGNDTNMHDLDLHLGVGKAEYVMEFKKEIVTHKFLWWEWTETVYSAKITLSDTYNFDEYREGASISNSLNNWGYDMQKEGKLTPYYWTISFEKEEL